MTEPTYRMQWHGAHGMPKPQHAHVEPSPEGFTWTATDRYGVTETGTRPDEHEARLAAEEHALRPPSAYLDPEALAAWDVASGSARAEALAAVRRWLDAEPTAVALLLAERAARRPLDGMHGAFEVPCAPPVPNAIVGTVLDPDAGVDAEGRPLMAVRVPAMTLPSGLRVVVASKETLHAMAPGADMVLLSDRAAALFGKVRP